MSIYFSNKDGKPYWNNACTIGWHFYMRKLFLVLHDIFQWKTQFSNNGYTIWSHNHKATIWVCAITDAIFAWFMMALIILIKSHISLFIIKVRSSNSLRNILSITKTTGPIEWFHTWRVYESFDHWVLSWVCSLYGILTRTTKCICIEISDEMTHAYLSEYICFAIPPLKIPSAENNGIKFLIHDTFLMKCIQWMRPWRV